MSVGGQEPRGTGPRLHCKIPDPVEAVPREQVCIHAQNPSTQLCAFSGVRSRFTGESVRPSTLYKSFLELALPYHRLEFLMAQANQF